MLKGALISLSGIFKKAKKNYAVLKDKHSLLAMRYSKQRFVTRYRSIFKFQYFENVPETSL